MELNIEHKGMDKIMNQETDTEYSAEAKSWKEGKYVVNYREEWEKA